MGQIKTKHFQYTGTDDYDTSLDEQINMFIEDEKISADQLIDVKYSGHSSLGVNTYSALVIYKSNK
jgi:hypothetical protein